METSRSNVCNEIFSADIGMDWGDQEHVYQLRDSATGKITERKLRHRPDALQEWVSQLQQDYPDQKIAVAIEQSKGAVINFLMQFDFIVIFVIHPKLATKYRQAFKSSGAKDDGNDSGFILESLKRTRQTTIHSFYTQHGCRQRKVIESRLKAIQKAKPLTTDAAIIETSVIEVRMLTEQLLCVIKHIDKYNQAIGNIFPVHPDAKIFASLPGAGAVLAPRLLAAFGSDRDRFKTPEEIQNYSGIAPVTVQSGKKRLVRWRWACPKFIRQSFHEFAGESRKYSIWASAFYEKQRENGKNHNAAVRALAYKWIRILFRCWKERVAYDELVYIQALKSNGSDLFHYMAIL